VLDRYAHVDLKAFRQALMNWGKLNYRDFPWRKTDDPYLILMAEVMLHRTRALQVVPIYDRFIRRYPDLATLALAGEEELAEALHSLGLHWRVPLIQRMAADIKDKFDGHIPREKADLLSLPGVSDYIASAVRCFAWNLPDPLIDTNTVRIAGRIFQMKVTDYSRRSRKFREAIAALIDPEQPKASNYALLDLGDRICTKSRPPACQSCPVSHFCLY
jgi:A/G-specific adenine glycosylase